MLLAKPPVEERKIINHDLLFIRNAVKAMELKTGDKFDVYDPDSRALLLSCREPEIGGFTKLQRFLGGDHDVGGPFNLVAADPLAGEQVLRMRRVVKRFSFGSQPVAFFGADDVPLCQVAKKWLTLSLAFIVSTTPGQPLFEVRVKNSFHAFRFFIEKKEVAVLSTRWKGRSSDFFKGAFNYALAIDPGVPHDSIVRELLLAMALCFHRLRR